MKILARKYQRIFYVKISSNKLITFKKVNILHQNDMGMKNATNLHEFWFS